MIDSADIIRMLKTYHENLYATNFNNLEWTNSLKGTTYQNRHKKNR